MTHVKFSLVHEFKLSQVRSINITGNHEFGLFQICTCSGVRSQSANLVKVLENAPTAEWSSVATGNSPDTTFFFYE